MVAAKTNATGYDPQRSKVSDSTMNTFITSDISGVLTEVPGLGPAGVEKLCNLSEPITNTWQIIGKFLMLKGPNVLDENGNIHEVDCREHNNKFWTFLQETGINAHRSAIVKAIAEKTAQAYPGIYDPSAYEDA